ncbi:MAG: hypothetical protein ACLFU8_08685 [Anaerolineales bacterium]
MFSVTRAHPSRNIPHGLLLLLLTFSVLALAWNVNVPAYENLDELEHTEVIRHIAVERRLPVHGEAEAAGYHVRQEASQPPLYHILGALWVRLLGLSTAPPEATPVPGRSVECGLSDTFYNKATWERHPHDELAAPGHRRTVHGLRWLSLLLQTATVAGTWVLAQRLFPRTTIPLLSSAIVAFNPQFLLLSAGVNNDNLVTPLATWTLVLLLDLWQRGPTTGRLLALGTLTGLAGLSKLSGLGLLGLSAGVLVAYAVRERPPLPRLILWGLLIALPALTLLTPWLLRNYALYGDLTALEPMLEKVGRQASSGSFWGTVRLMALSYWGQLPCTFYPRLLYWPFFTLLAGGLLGLALHGPYFSRAQRGGLLLLIAWFVLIVAAWIRWNATTPATGGRLLFPAAAALAVLLAAGWYALEASLRLPLARLGAVALALGGLISLLLGPVYIFAPPPLVSELMSSSQQVELTFGERVRLQGYHAEIVRPRAACWFASSTYCRPSLAITLEWQALETLEEDLLLVLQLVSSRPGDNTLRLSYHHWPGKGNLPTSAWPTERIVRDRYLIPLPESTFSTQAWELQVALLDPEEHRLQVTREGLDLGNAAVLTTLRVPGTAAPSCPEENALPTSPVFGDRVALTHAWATPVEAGQEVHLCWETLAPLERRYTVFVHAYDAGGELVSTGDGPPLAGAFPTSLWLPGDVVHDIHLLPLSFTSEELSVAVGLYDPESGLRLPASHGGEPLTHDAFSLPKPALQSTPP